MVHISLTSVQLSVLPSPALGVALQHFVEFVARSELAKISLPHSLLLLNPELVVIRPGDRQLRLNLIKEVTKELPRVKFVNLSLLNSL